MTVKMEQLSAQMAELQARVDLLAQHSGGITAVVADIKKLLMDQGGARIIELTSPKGALLGLSWTYAARRYTLMPEDISEHGWQGQRAWLHSTAAHAPMGLHGSLMTYSESALKFFRRPVQFDPALAQRLQGSGSRAVAAHPEVWDHPNFGDPHAAPDLIDALSARLQTQEPKPKTRTRRTKSKES